MPDWSLLHEGSCLGRGLRGADGRWVFTGEGYDPSHNPAPAAPPPAGAEAARVVTLSTAPEAGYTHWGQQLFTLRHEIEMREGDVLRGTLWMRRQAESARLYDLEASARTFPRTFPYLSRSL